ncbi:zinc finger, CCHC-type containing protein [Tanacetum coccineum]
MFVIEQPIPHAPAADSKANELKSMFEKQAGVERFDLIQTFHACKQEEGKPVTEYVLKMKGYLDQLEHLSYMLSQDLSVGLILNGLTSDFAGFKANKKSLKARGKGKANGKGKDKQVYIPKPKNPKPTAKEHPAKDDTCHHCKEVGHWKRNYPVYLAKLLKKKKQVGTASSLVHVLVEMDLSVFFNGMLEISVSKNNILYFNVIPSNGMYEIDMHDLVPNLILFIMLALKEPNITWSLLIYGIGRLVRI